MSGMKEEMGSGSGSDDESYMASASYTQFWSLTVQPGKRYEQELPLDLVITQITLGDDAEEGEKRTLYFNEEDEETPTPICHLREGKCEQFATTLHFSQGETISFSSPKGQGTIYLIGYVVIDQSLLDMSDDESESDSEDSEDEKEALREMQKQQGTKRKLEGASAPPAKKRKQDAPQTPKTKASTTENAKKNKAAETPKKNNAAETPKKNNTAETPKKNKATETPKREEATKARKDTPAKAATPKAPSKEMQKKFPNGLSYKIMQIGAGPVAKRGKKITMQYKGTLKNGKVFDSGKISFRLGVGEVIKGWDQGIVGMQTGEKRVLICPPKTAYGNKKLDGIPPNSTLTFETTLLNVQ